MSARPCCDLSTCRQPKLFNSLFVSWWRYTARHDHTPLSKTHRKLNNDTVQHTILIAVWATGDLDHWHFESSRHGPAHQGRCTSYMLLFTAKVSTFAHLAMLVFPVPVSPCTTQTHTRRIYAIKPSMLSSRHGQHFANAWATLACIGRVAFLGKSGSSCKGKQLSVTRLFATVRSFDGSQEISGVIYWETAAGEITNDLT